ncbi:hypothetical protein [Vibrio galatheae]|uniref:hypothetical protein n=1 Tax=Vibrio galatheae TaxID=579748 RepID=UPI0012EED5E7|nr:hypothetical protein [Vibrio galatheae]
MPDELVRNEHIKVRPYQHTIDTLQSLSEETGVPVAVIAMYLIDSNVGELLNEIDQAAAERG